MDIDKDKLPKGLVYPLKTSMLESALAEAGITTYVHLLYNRQSPHLLEAFYWLPNANVPHDRFYIRTSAVEIQQVSTLRQQLETSVIPEFVDWASELLSLPENSPKLHEGNRRCWGLSLYL